MKSLERLKIQALRLSNIIILGTIFIPFNNLLAKDCSLEIKEQSFYFDSKSNPYTFKIISKRICSGGMGQIQIWSSNRFEVFLNEQKVLAGSSLSADWSPIDQKGNFVQVVMEYPCKKKLRNLFIDLDKNILTSRDGLYLNFKSGRKLGWECKSFSSK